MNAGIMKQLEEHGKASIYPTGRRNKKGEEVYGIAFYYDDIKEGRKRKVITGNKEELLQKKSDFLTSVYRLNKSQEPGNTSVPPACAVTLKKAVDEFLIQYEPTVSHSTFSG